MEEQNKNSEKQTTETESSQENKQQSTPTRSCVLMLLAGCYLLYTGYRLCRNVIDGVEGGNWGFFAAGIGFLIVGAVMLVVGGRNFIKNDKEKKAMEAAAQKNAEPEPEPEQPAEKKSMSIAERARLVSDLNEAEMDNTSDVKENTDKTEE